MARFGKRTFDHPRQKITRTVQKSSRRRIRTEALGSQCVSRKLHPRPETLLHCSTSQDYSRRVCAIARFTCPPEAIGANETTNIASSFRKLLADALKEACGLGNRSLSHGVTARTTARRKKQSDEDPSSQPKARLSRMSAYRNKRFRVSVYHRYRVAGLTRNLIAGAPGGI